MTVHLFGIPVVLGRLLPAFTTLRRTKRHFVPRKILILIMLKGQHDNLELQPETSNAENSDKGFELKGANS